MSKPGGCCQETRWIANVLPTLNNAKIFSKLDVKYAFWHVQLDSPSSLLTTMITWTGLPFGLRVSSEIF